MKRICFVAGMLLALNVAHAVELYRWVDKNGVVHYSEHPNPEAEKIRVGAAVPGNASEVEDASLPYQLRMAHQNFPVTLYVFDACGDTCGQARDFLKKRRVPFVEIMLKTPEDWAGLKQKSGSDSAPTVSIGRNWIKGFQAESWNSELDAAGYPK